MSRDGGEKITRGRRNGMPEKKEPGILRPLLDLPLSQITRDAVAEWLEREAPKRATRTRLALSLLATFVKSCTDRPERSEARRVGKGCVRTCRSRRSPYHSNKKG